MILSNSSQPYLFIDQNNQKNMLYCYADHSINLSFGQYSYAIRPWKIKKINLTSNQSVDIKTVLYHKEYGRVTLECNPHIKIENGLINLYYTAGFMSTDHDPIKYYLCSMTADNLNLDNLRDFRVVHKTFSGTILDNNFLLFVDKIYGKDVLINKNLSTNMGSVVPTEYLNLSEILRVTNVFDSSQIILTCKTTQQFYASYLLNSDLSINKTIKNSYDMDIYKCSILGDLLAYTVRNESYGGDDPESRSIVIEGNITT